MDPELKRILALSDLHDAEPSLKRASQWLMKPVELERLLSLAWQGDESTEDDCTAWWLLRCMARYLGAEEAVDEQQARVVYRRFGTPDPEYWFLAHVVVHGHRYFRYDESFILPGQMKETARSECSVRPFLCETRTGIRRTRPIPTSGWWCATGLPGLWPC